MQAVIDNLMISKIEHRTESDPDVKPYVFTKLINVEKVAAGGAAKGMMAGGKRAK